MEVLGTLLGSPHRAKILRLFLLNPGEIFNNSEISRRSKVSSAPLRREISVLSRAGVIRKKITGWQLDKEFDLLPSLKEFIFSAIPVTSKELLEKIKSVGKIKLIITAGVFIGEENSRVDLLIVGNSIKDNILNKILKDFESKIGKELECAIFTVDEFNYRLEARDRFIRDILDYSNEKILNKLNV